MYHCGILCWKILHRVFVQKILFAYQDSDLFPLVKKFNPFNRSLLTITRSVWQISHKLHIVCWYMRCEYVLYCETVKQIGILLTQNE